MPKQKIGLIGPGQDKPCGINDYVQELLVAFNQQTEAVYFNYQEALGTRELADCESVFLHYEASIVPYSNYMEAIGKILSTRLVVIPHEIYDEDPFAFPYSEIDASNKLSLWLKQLNYRLKHKNYILEKKLQSKGYYAAKVIPLSQVNYNILKKLGADNLEGPIPLAYDPEYSDEKKVNDQPAGCLGVFGFLNRANNYQEVFQALKGLPERVTLKLIGGEKEGEALSGELMQNARDFDIKERVEHTGFLSAEEIKKELSLCSAFICPYKFRSNSSSLLKLIPWNRPVLASRIPMTEELKESGAPIQLYDTSDQLKDLINRHLEGKLKSPPNQYIYDFETVVKMYLKRVN